MTVRRDFTFYFLLAFSCLPLISVVLPRFMTFLPSALGLGAYIFLVVVRQQPLPLSRFYLLIALGISLLCGLSAFSSGHPEEVIWKAVTTGALIFSGVFLIAVCRTLDPQSLKNNAWVFPALLTLAALIGAAELSFRMPLYQVFHDTDPARTISTAVLNRGAVNIVLCAFAALSLIRVWDAPPQMRLFLGSTLFGAIVLMLALSQAQVAQLAFVFGFGVYFLYPAGWRPGHRVLAAFLCLLLLTAPWLAQWMFATLAADAQTLPWLKSGYAGARMEIWDFTSRYALQNPLAGHGMDATRYVESFDHARLYHREDSVLHPHNFALQLWVDFGFAGAVWGCALLGTILEALRREGSESARCGLTLFLLVLLVAAISYGLWQSHWIGVMIYVLALYHLVRATLNPSPEELNIRQS
ncbi:MAG: O-antigen ligase family protein [Alphaproteobacteria bacterium]|nr:O-antigen ligase family protein [Alphaproteobacteria bacterium]MBP7758220.1 O-antigen ligase family protein [Alphaproteobacteria bacterium]MBP7761637.1 O-antigen ligase family protein [Alphaproteobacteria bacterium]MBP7904011.1 O-antigen ligase family protein [Alphaproteobacteria bacterium]